MVEIRELTEDDMPRVGEILRQHTLSDYSEEAYADVMDRIEGFENIALAAVGPAETVVGFSTSIVYSSRADQLSMEVVHPDSIDLPAEPRLLLKRGFVDSSYQGQGIGTKLCEESIRRGVREYCIEVVCCETWVKPDYPSSDELLETLGFKQEYYDADYYSEFDEKAAGTCDGCDEDLSECRCSGAIYVHREPREIV